MIIWKELGGQCVVKLLRLERFYDRNFRIVKFSTSFDALSPFTNTIKVEIIRSVSGAYTHNKIFYTFNVLVLGFICVSLAIRLQEMEKNKWREGQNCHLDWCSSQHQPQIRLKRLPPTWKKPHRINKLPKKYLFLSSMQTSQKQQSLWQLTLYFSRILDINYL